MPTFSPSLRSVLLLPVSLLLAACATTAALVPAPEAQRLQDREQAAVAQHAGVRMTADASAWRGFPSSLETVVPVKLRIENHSQQPLRLRFADFSLRMQQGLQLSALPPIKLQGSEYVESGYGGSGYAISPRFGFQHFRIARPYGWYYPGLSSWGGPWAYDPLYYDRAYRAWPVDLPTPDMVSQAMPEGVLEPGGYVEGFIYFQNLPRDEQRASLRAQLVNAQTGEQFGQLELPFVYRGW